MECEICCETMNKSNYKPISCPSCDKTICRTCFNRVLLDAKEPTCLFCLKSLSHMFVSMNTTRKFYKEQYCKHRAELRLSAERSLLPECQHLAVIERKKLEMHEKAEEIRFDIVLLKYFRKEFMFGLFDKNDCSESDRIKMIESLDKIKELKKEADELDYFSKRTYYHSTTQKKPVEEKVFVHACTVDGCKGFLDNKWKCGTCETRICKRCNEPLENGHVCDEELVKNVKAIKNECKNCPGCATPIYKIDGCDLMWCTKCHAQFSWEKGVITHGHNHNPHYFQWVRENRGVVPREPGDICPRDREMLYTFSDLQIFLKHKGQYFPNLSRCYNLPLEIRETTFEYNSDSECLNHRIWYLCNQLTEEDWLEHLRKIILKEEHSQEMNQVLNVAEVAIPDIFNRFLQGLVENLYVEMEALRVYINKQLYSIRTKYGLRTKHIHKSWYLFNS